MNPIRLSFMVVFMYWSLEVPIWSLRPGRGAGQLGFVEETPWMGVLTQNWSHHFFLQYEMFRIYLGWFKRLPFWDESSQVALTKKKGTLGFLSPNFQRPKSNMNKANAAIPESHSFLVVAALLLWNSMRHFQPTGYKTTYDNLYVHGFQSLGMLITFLFSMLISAMRWAMRCAGW